MMKSFFYSFFATVLSVSCTQSPSTNTDSAPVDTTQVPVVMEDTGFVSLMSLEKWRNYLQDTISNKWELQDGALTLNGKGGGDIVTRDIYENFELKLEWKISEKGNSGVFFHVAESDTLKAVYWSGPEMQVLDNERHPDARIPMHRASDNYDLHACSKETVKKAGEWNTVRLIVNNKHVEHWLNGEMVVSYDLQSPDWETRFKKSKFKNWPMYGRAGKGHIALQDHGDKVWFKNIEIKKL